MSTLSVPLEGSLTDRGQVGQWAYLIHWIASLGTLLFPIVHAPYTSTVYSFPNVTVHAIAIQRSRHHTVGEIVLVLAVLYHGASGPRIAMLDLCPHSGTEPGQRRALRLDGVTSFRLNGICAGTVRRAPR